MASQWRLEWLSGPHGPRAGGRPAGRRRAGMDDLDSFFSPAAPPAASTAAARPTPAQGAPGDLLGALAPPAAEQRRQQQQQRPAMGLLGDDAPPGPTAHQPAHPPAGDDVWGAPAPVPPRSLLPAASPDPAAAAAAPATSTSLDLDSFFAPAAPSPSRDSQQTLDASMEAPPVGRGAGAAPTPAPHTLLFSFTCSAPSPPEGPQGGGAAQPDTGYWCPRPATPGPPLFVRLHPRHRDTKQLTAGCRCILRGRRRQVQALPLGRRPSAGCRGRALAAPCWRWRPRSDGGDSLVQLRCIVRLRRWGGRRGAATRRARAHAVALSGELCSGGASVSATDERRPPTTPTQITRAPCAQR